jgi:hypothetical protein
LSTISGLRYTTTDPSQPGRPTLLNLATTANNSGGHEEAPPLQVTTVNGNQFVCLNLNNEESGHNTSTYVTASDLNQCYASLSDTYITAAAAAAAGHELRGLNTASFVTTGTLSPQQLSAAAVEQHHHHQQQQQLFQPGMVQTPVHSQVVIQRIGTLPRQYAHPLAHH